MKNFFNFKKKNMEDAQEKIVVHGFHRDVVNELNDAEDVVHECVYDKADNICSIITDSAYTIDDDLDDILGEFEYLYDVPAGLAYDFQNELDEIFNKNSSIEEIKEDIREFFSEVWNR